MRHWALLAVFLMSRSAIAGGSFDTGYGIWSPSGLWHRVAAPACVAPQSGTACLYYGLDPSCDYATGLAQDASLTTIQPVTLTASTAFISFWLLYEVQSYDPACQDRLRLEYSPDNATWYLADELGTQTDPAGGSPAEGWASGSGLGGPPLWQFQRVDLASFAGTSYYWRFRYLSSDQMAGNGLCSPPDLLQQFLGYALDSVSLGDPPPPLALSKSVAPAIAPPGATFTFTLAAVNMSPGPADLEIWDTLPSPYATATAPGGTVAGGLASWAFPAVPAGQTVTAQVMVQSQPSAAPPLDWINTAAASSSVSPTAVFSDQVLAKIRDPALALAKSVSPTEVTSGNAATYLLVLENDTSLTQSALTLSDNVPPAFSPTQVFPADSGATYWALPSLAPGQVLSFTLLGTVFGQNGQQVVNTAQVAQGTSVGAQAEASLTIQRPVQPTISVQAVFPNPAPSHAAGAPQEAFVAYTLSQAMPVELDIFDVAGERVRSLSLPGQAGEQQAGWDLKNAYGRPVASGVYVLRLWSPASAQPQPQATAYAAVLW